MNSDVGMHLVKKILSNKLAQRCVSLCLEDVGRFTHDCANIIDGIAKITFCFHYF